MSKRREVENHRKQLMEIRDIMNSMKNLAYLETRKLSQRLISQKKAVEPIEKAASDLMQFHPEIRPKADISDIDQFILVIGSERGFCGDYNETLMKHLEQNAEKNTQLIIVGNKLGQRLEIEGHAMSVLAGPSAVDEASDVINQIIEILTSIAAAGESRSLRLVYHDPDTKQVVMDNVLPLFSDFSVVPPPYTVAPDVNFAPQVLLNEIAEHYLFALLYRAIYSALMAENQSRIDHMENALRRIDEKTEGLNQQCNTLRQEEIIEEIEIILLNTRLASKRHEKRLLPKEKH